MNFFHAPGVLHNPSLALPVYQGTATSMMGTAWSETAWPVDSTNIAFITYCNNTQKFVAIGYNGTLTTTNKYKVWTSPDGITWTYLSDIAWANTTYISGWTSLNTAPDGTMVIHTYYYNSAASTYPHVAKYSKNGGLTWTTAATYTNHTFNAVAKTSWANGYFWTVITNTSAGKSADGITWASAGTGIATGAQVLGHDSVVVGVNNYSSSGLTNVRSINGGTTWETSVTATSAYTANGSVNVFAGTHGDWGAYSHSLGQFVTVNTVTSGEFRLLISDDGLTWTGAVLATGASYARNSPVWTGYNYIAPCAVASLGKIFTSLDGVTWTAQPDVAGMGAPSIAVSPTLLLANGGGKFWLSSS